MILQPVLVTIPNAASVAPAVDLGGQRLLGFSMPAAWTAADLTFQTSAHGTTYANFYDDLGNEVLVKAAAQRAVRVSNPGLWLGVKFLIVRSGTSGTPVNQGGARDIYLVLAD